MNNDDYVFRGVTKMQRILRDRKSFAPLLLAQGLGGKLRTRISILNLIATWYAHTARSEPTLGQPLAATSRIARHSP